MSRIYADNAHSICNTPLVQINRMIDQQAFTRAADDIFLGSAFIFLLLISLIWLTKRPALHKTASTDGGGAH